MKAFYVLLASLIAGSTQAGRIWGVDMDKKKEREENEKARAVPSNTMRRFEETGGLGLEDLALGTATGDIDFTSILTEALDAVIALAEDPEQRAQFDDPQQLKSMLSSIPGMESETMQDVLGSSLGLDALTDMDPQEYKKEVHAKLDAMAKGAKELKGVVKDPEALANFADEAMKAMGLDKETRGQMLELLADPMSLYESWKSLASDPDMLKSIDELVKMWTDPSAMQTEYEKLLQDPAMQELLKDPSMQELVNDPQKWAALMQEMGAPAIGGGGAGAAGAAGGAGAGAGFAGGLPRRGRRPVNFQEQLNAARRA